MSDLKFKSVFFRTSIEGDEEGNGQRDALRDNQLLTSRIRINWSLNFQLDHFYGNCELLTRTQQFDLFDTLVILPANGSMFLHANTRGLYL